MKCGLVVAILLSIALVVTAKPAKGKGGKDKKDKVMSLTGTYCKLCEGLGDGDIKNTQNKFNDVFESFEETCEGVLKFKDEDDKEYKKKDKKDKKDKKKEKENKAVDMLMYICQSIGVQEYMEFSDHYPSDLVAIYLNETYPICLEAYQIAEGDADDVFLELCEGIAEGDYENEDDQYDAWFDAIEGPCNELIEALAEDGEEETLPRKKKGGKGDKGGKKDKENEVNEVLVMLTQACIKLEEEGGVEGNFTGDIEGVCELVLEEGPEHELEELCEDLESGDLKNKDKKLKMAFKKLDLVCEDVLEEEDAVEEMAKKDKKKEDKKGGKGKKAGEAELRLNSWCTWVNWQMTVGIPVDYPVELVYRYETTRDICDVVMT